MNSLHILPIDISQNLEGACSYYLTWTAFFFWRACILQRVSPPLTRKLLSVLEANQQVNNSKLPFHLLPYPHPVSHLSASHWTRDLPSQISIDHVILLRRSCERKILPFSPTRSALPTLDLVTILGSFFLTSFICPQHFSGRKRHTRCSFLWREGRLDVTTVLVCTFT